MAIEIINVGGIDYDVRDQQSRSYCEDLYGRTDEKPHIHAIMGDEESTDYYHIARGENSFFIWRSNRDTYPKNGYLMKTTRAVVAGETILLDYNCTRMPVVHAAGAMNIIRENHSIYYQIFNSEVRGLGDFAILDTPNTFSRPNKYVYEHGISKDNYDEAPLITAQHAQHVRSGGRATIAFHNGEHNACQVYLDPDGNLYFQRDDGVAKRFVLETI